jgi:hypothetical protein
MSKKATTSKTRLKKRRRNSGGKNVFCRQERVPDFFAVNFLGQANAD